MRRGIIGLPLRLLAREVYNRVAARVGADQVALITGEEKIVPPAPRFRVCTVEAMPAEIDAAFLAIDEIQLAGDLERGHVFTDRILHLRGREETLLLGAATMRGIVEKLVPGVNVVTRPRMSVLAYAGSKKITRLPRALGGGRLLGRRGLCDRRADPPPARRRGRGARLAQSPRTRNAQVEMFQSGDVDFLVATDAIGMGLNLDLDHVAFAADRKFDGYQYPAAERRRARPGRGPRRTAYARRHLRRDRAGSTRSRMSWSRRSKRHRFEPVRTVQWRNRDLDFCLARGAEGKPRSAAVAAKA